MLADYTSSDEDARKDAVNGGGKVAASATEEEGKVSASKMGGCKDVVSLTGEENALCKNAAASANEEKGAGKVTTGEQQKDAPSFTSYFYSWVLNVISTCSYNSGSKSSLSGRMPRASNLDLFMCGSLYRLPPLIFITSIMHA